MLLSCFNLADCFQLIELQISVAGFISTHCSLLVESQSVYHRVNPSPKWWWALKMGRWEMSHSNTCKFLNFNGPFEIFMGRSKIWWAQESLISTLELNWHEIWIACIWDPAKNKVHFSKTLIVFSQNGSGPPLDEPWYLFSAQQTTLCR